MFIYTYYKLYDGGKFKDNTRSLAEAEEWENSRYNRTYKKITEEIPDNTDRSEKLRNLFSQNACWLDKIAFVIEVYFKDFPEWLFKWLNEDIRNLIEPEDAEYGGFLECIYFAETENFVYHFCFEEDCVDVTEQFNTPLINGIIKSLAI